MQKRSRLVPTLVVSKILLYKFVCKSKLIWDTPILLWAAEYFWPSSNACSPLWLLLKINSLKKLTTSQLQWSFPMNYDFKTGTTRYSTCDVFYSWMSNNTRALSVSIWKKGWQKHVQTIITSLTLVRCIEKYFQLQMWQTLNY